MTNDLKRILTSSVAAGALVLNMALPAMAKTTLTISGNGADSDNSVSSTRTTTSTTSQTNSSSVSNDVSTDQDSGNNDIDEHTGGDAEITTGDNDDEVNISNDLGRNTADVNNTTSGDDVTLDISGNGADSDNEIDVEHTTAAVLFQTNVAEVNNSSDTTQDSGDNDVDEATGGSVSIDTGSNSSRTSMSTEAGVNNADLALSLGGDVMLDMNGNGADSDNSMDIALANSVILDQSNLTAVDNTNDVDSETGDNEVDEATGAGVDITTGDNSAMTDIENMVGFNTADVSDVWVDSDLEGTIEGNGADSDNELVFDFVDAAVNFQTNADELDSSNDVSQDTGDNEDDESTGGDSTIDTGSNSSDTTITNEGGVNTL